VHRVLAQAWSQLKSKDALDAISAADLEILLRQAAEEAVARIKRDRPTTLSGRFAEIERQRLVRLARAWLEAEKQRSGFTVVATEDKRRVEIGGLGFNTRLDRVDQAQDGRRIVIDYKTNAPPVGAMLGERPDEPQLPLYLVTAEPGATAVAFAQVKAGEMRFAALARDGDLLPKVKAFSESYYRDRHASWNEVVEAWRIDLARIAAGFAAGDARVDPRNTRTPAAIATSSRSAASMNGWRMRSSTMRTMKTAGTPHERRTHPGPCRTPRALDPAQSFIVQAPAGSGKTELLIQRYLRLLAIVDHPEEIVAVTFTRKAAGEMRERVLEALADAQAGATPATEHETLTLALANAALQRDTTAGWRITDNPARLRIQTIDSLCAALTRQMPVLSRFGSQPESVEDAAELYLEAARATVELVEGDDAVAQDVERLLAHLDNDVKRIEDLLADMLARRDHWLRRINVPGREELEATLRNVRCEALARVRDLFPAPLNNELIELVRYAAANLVVDGSSSPSRLAPGSLRCRVLKIRVSLSGRVSLNCYW